MEKQNILNEYKRQVDKMFLAQVLDKIEFVSKRNKIECTDFLDMYQISLVKNLLNKIEFKNYCLFGGYENAERNILILYPDEYDLNMLEKNYNKFIKILRITLDNQSNFQKLEHRNYLGAVVKVGMDRGKVGDILVFDNGADMLVKQESIDSLKISLSLLNRFENARFEILDLENIREKEIKLEEMSIIVPSFRLDNFVSDLAKTSRSRALQIINETRVFINGKNEMKASKQIKQGDIITIRGKGKFIIKEFSGNTRSGRTIVKIEKYV